MKHAIEIGTAGKPLTTSDIEDSPDIAAVHRSADIAGIVRESQNWIGGTTTTRSAPPTCRHRRVVRPLLDDLCAFAPEPILRQSSRPGSRTPSSRASTRSPTATVAWPSAHLRRPSPPRRDPQLRPSDSLILAAEPMGTSAGSLDNEKAATAHGSRSSPTRPHGRRPRPSDSPTRRVAPINLARRPRPTTQGRRRPTALQFVAAAARDRRRGRRDAHRQVPRHRWRGSAGARARGDPAQAQRAQVGQRLGVGPAAQLGRCVRDERPGTRPVATPGGGGPGIRVGVLQTARRPCGRPAPPDRTNPSLRRPPSDAGSSTGVSPRSHRATGPTLVRRGLRGVSYCAVELWATAATSSLNPLVRRSWLASPTPAVPRQRPRARRASRLGGVSARSTAGRASGLGKIDRRAPDRDPPLTSDLRTRLVLENIDDRKNTGRTADEIEAFFEKLPDAGFR